MVLRVSPSWVCRLVKDGRFATVDTPLGRLLLRDDVDAMSARRQEGVA